MAVILIRWVPPSDPRRPPGAGVAVTAVVLFPPEIKRRLATIEAATRHALDLARRVALTGLPHPAELERLSCTVEIRSDCLAPRGEPFLITEEGIRVWLQKTGDG